MVDGDEYTGSSQLRNKNILYPGYLYANILQSRPYSFVWNVTTQAWSHDMVLRKVGNEMGLVLWSCTVVKKWTTANKTYMISVKCRFKEKHYLASESKCSSLASGVAELQLIRFFSVSVFC